MGMKFRKSVKIAPSVKLNIGKKSTGVSVGGKYGGMSFNSKSGAKTRVSIPGTGISFSESISKKGKSEKSANQTISYTEDSFESTRSPLITFSKKTAKKLSDTYLRIYIEDYSESLKEISRESDPELFEKVSLNLQILNNESKRRLEKQIDPKDDKEPSLKLLICGIVCCICGLITWFFTSLGVVFLIIGFIMLLLELKK